MTKTFEENFRGFNRRTPKKRLGDKVDTTHMRFIDSATAEEIAQEYEIIKQKQSDLSSKERTLIIKMFEDGK